MPEQPSPEVLKALDRINRIARYVERTQKADLTKDLKRVNGLIATFKLMEDDWSVEYWEREARKIREELADLS